MVMAKDRPSFIVTNYRTVDDTIEDTNPIAAVAMEYAKGTDPTTGLDTIGDPFTKFYVFDGKTGNRLLAADLDRGGRKFVPGLCIVCHGGIDHSADYQSSHGNVNAHFLPFDLNALDYSCDPMFTRTAQEGAFKQLNQGVLEIEAGTTTSPANKDFNVATMTTLITLIEGWYGTNFTLPAPPTMPRLTQNSEFIPPGWTNRPNLYLNVVARSCRNCHSTRPASFLSFGSASEFNAFIKSFVFGTTDLNPSSITQIQTRGPIMPHARRTFERFWLSTSPRPQAEILREYLNNPSVDPP